MCLCQRCARKATLCSRARACAYGIWWGWLWCARRGNRDITPLVVYRRRKKKLKTLPIPEKGVVVVVLAAAAATTSTSSECVLCVCPPSGECVCQQQPRTTTTQNNPRTAEFFLSRLRPAVCFFARRSWERDRVPNLCFWSERSICFKFVVNW